MSCCARHLACKISDLLLQLLHVLLDPCLERLQLVLRIRNLVFNLLSKLQFVTLSQSEGPFWTRLVHALVYTLHKVSLIAVVSIRVAKKRQPAKRVLPASSSPWPP